MTSQINSAEEERLPPVHPGEVLLEDFMKPLGLTQYRLAQDLGVSALRISQIVHGKRTVTCLLYTSDAADERSSVDLGGRRIIKKKKQIAHQRSTSYDSRQLTKI